MKSPLKYRILAFAAILISSGLYGYQGYFLSRDNFQGFFGSYLVLFALFYWLWLNKPGFKFSHFFILAIVFRLILLFAAPALSNDFFRFIWDGELITNGINPYAHKPDDLISFGGFLDEERMRILYHGMGELSQQNYSCYPPLNQLFFVIPAAVSDSIPVQLFVFKLMMILADVGIILVAKRIAEQLRLNSGNIWLFALNPLIILEFTGNLHFEGVMIFFMLCSVHLLLKNQWIFSSVFFAFAVQVKLIPLIILPLLWKKLGLRRMIGYAGISAILILLIGKLFMNEIFFQNMMRSVDLYFDRFEFNAGIFYLIREAGFLIVGYDTIGVVMPVFTKIILVVVLMLAILRKYTSGSDLMISIMFSFAVFYGLSSIVHPWYISLILIFSVFTEYRFALIWSFLVMLSYSAYGESGVVENKLFLITEYVLVFAVLIYEIIKYRKSGMIDLQIDKLTGKEK